MKGIISSLTFGAGLYFFLQCKWLQITKYEIESEVIPKEFHGYKIVHISDLHDCYYGSNDKNYLIDKISSLNPDIVMATGDFFDRNSRYKNAYLILKKLSEKYPVFFITGSHDYACDKFDIMKKRLTKVTFLSNQTVFLSKGTGHIAVTGINDRGKFKSDMEFEDVLKRLNQENKFNILLSHRPDLFDVYEQYGYEMILSGHVHGGIIRFPGGKGLVSYDEGLFPQYSEGIHVKNNSALIINRGIGWHTTFTKINNRPEIGLITLLHK